MEYADYEFYCENYKGGINNPDLFNSLIVKASREIDRNVNCEINEDIMNDKIRYVACELVDYFKDVEDSNLSSLSIDGVSKVYKTNQEITKNKKHILDGLPQELTRYL